MTDIFDDATDAEMRETEALVTAKQAQLAHEAQLGAAREAARGDGPAVCMGCEETIPMARREAVPGCLRCARCERHRANRSSAPR